MWLTLVKGIFTTGVPFIKDWWAGKQEEAYRELEIKKQESLTLQQIKLQQAKAEVTNTSERIKQMAKSFKDEFTMIVIFTPLITSMISPYVDLFYVLKVKDYQQGMLAEASLVAIQSLDSFPIWYVAIVMVMILYSWGANNDMVTKFFDIINFRKS